MVDFKRHWKRIERAAVYTALFALVLIELLAIFMPVVRTTVERGASLLLVALILLALFRMLDERLPDRQLTSNLVAETFGSAVKTTLGDDDHIRQLSLYGLTSSKYYQFIRDRGIRIASVRLLVCQPCLGWCVEAPNGPAAQKTAAELTLAVTNWKRLKQEGLIDSLDIRTYGFHTSFHFMIVDGQRATFGLFRPDDDPAAGYRTMHNLVFFSATDSGRRFIEDLAKLFDAVFEKLSAPYEQQ